MLHQQRKRELVSLELLHQQRKRKLVSLELLHQHRKRKLVARRRKKEKRKAKAPLLPPTRCCAPEVRITVLAGPGSVIFKMTSSPLAVVSPVITGNIATAASDKSPFISASVSAKFNLATNVLLAVARMSDTRFKASPPVETLTS